ncbi:mitochondrial carrier protein [Raphidocelis subcapitata]|uniref:Mitochondrial carrier protein n=1 Tax=Raphidocelis subcapitata TaxID=307507 RepID=A0A2V0P425_9CHLO|nr:mitochondrial carrier protein [Raphidocelis subcapitata]|eukprot:GBF92603.1 mitochondrial carrier protein [Raphidocelis subcapitata]
MASPEVDWDRLDKTKVFFVGVPLFSAVTTTLYPLTVVKTRQMASHGVPGGIRGSCQTAAAIWRADGVRGFYRGFGTVVFGTIPGRTVYLTTLELTKAALQQNEALVESMAPTALAGASNFAAGGVASLATQVVAVPVDVVSQRLMVHGADLGAAPTAGTGGGSGGSGGGGGAAAAGGGGASNSGRGGAASSSGQGSAPAAAAAGKQQQQARSFSSSGASGSASQQRRAAAWRSPAGAVAHLRPPLHGVGSGACGAFATAAAHARMNGFEMARLIVREEGLRGLWRGLVPSAALYVPNSAIWWGCYGGWQSLIWLSLHPEAAASDADGAPPAAHGSSTEIVAVQTAAAALAGACAAVLTTPLDVLKTRLQVSGGGGSWTGLLRELLREEGPRGLWRGLAPRVASSSIFGVAMTTTYQALKRWCAVEPQQ